MVQMSRHRAHSILNVILLGLSILLTHLNLFGQDLYEQVSSTDKLIIQYPTVYAITNARIVTGTGQTIGNGSLVLKDGLIESVGSSIDVPAEAEVINADGMTVYPGFIDVHTALGFHPPKKEAVNQIGKVSRKKMTPINRNPWSMTETSGLIRLHWQTSTLTTDF